MPKITDADNFRRTLTGLCLIAAPLTGLAGGLLLPHAPDDTSERLAFIAETSSRLLISELLFISAAALLIPAALGLMHLMRHRSVALGHAAVGLLLLGNLFNVAHIGFVLAQIPIARGGGDGAQMVALADRMFTEPAFAVLILPFLIFFFLGLILLAIALWRARIAPIWVAAVIVAAPASDFVGPDAMVPSLAFALLLVGFGWIGLKVLRMPDEEWAGKDTLVKKVHKRGEPCPGR